MQFSENSYVELKDASGAAAPEAMVDPRATAISSEWLQANAAGQTVGMTDFPYGMPNGFFDGFEKAARSTGSEVWD